MPNGMYYAEVPVLLDQSGKFNEVLQKLWPESRWPFRDTQHSEGLLQSTKRNNKERLFESAYPIVPPPQINEVIIPTGASRYGRALLLFDHEMMVAMAASVWNYAPDNPSNPVTPDYVGNSSYSGIWGDEWNYRELLIEYDGNQFKWQMTMLTPQRLNGGLWLVPLVDRRYFLNYKQRNIDDGSSASGITWFSLFSDIDFWMPIEHPTIPDAYLIPDKETFLGENEFGIGHAVDAAALSVGLRAVPVNEGTELQLMTAEESYELITNNYILQNQAVPRKLQLGGFSPQAPQRNFLFMQHPILRNHFDCGGIHESVGVFANGISTTTGYSTPDYSVYSTCWAQYEGDQILESSDVEIDELAEQFTEDLMKWARWSHGGVFAAVADYSITGHDDYYSIGFSSGARLHSRVRPLPNSFFPKVQLSQSRSFFKHSDDTIICRTTSEITARAVNQYGSGTAVPRRLSQTGVEEDATKSDGTAITITIYNGGDDAISEEERVQCKRKDCLPIVDIDSGASGGGGGGGDSALPIVAFTLTGDMASLSAPATIDDSYGEALSGSITVTDPQNLFRFAKSGAKGFALKDEATYIVFECDQLALQVMATIAGQSGSPSFGLKPSTIAKVSLGWEPLTPPPFGQNPLGLSSIDIPNPLKLWASAGDDVVLQFDQATGSYFVLNVVRRASIIKGQLTANLQSTDASATIDTVQGMDGYIGDTSVTALNIHGWTGYNNAIVKAHWNVVMQQWEMIQIDC